MSQQRERKVLALTEKVRQLSDAIVVVGVLPGGRMFWSCDDRIKIADLHGVLRTIPNDVCASVARDRQARSNGGRG